jgi:hypothetical protein
MVTIEQPCYTLINLPSDSDPPNEMQLKMDLGMLLFLYCSVGVALFAITFCNYINIYIGLIKTHMHVKFLMFIYGLSSSLNRRN